jgi:hypothetical protein
MQFSNYVQYAVTIFTHYIEELKQQIFDCASRINILRKTVLHWNTVYQDVLFKVPVIIY